MAISAAIAKAIQTRPMLIKMSQAKPLSVNRRWSAARTACGAGRNCGATSPLALIAVQIRRIAAKLAIAT